MSIYDFANDGSGQERRRRLLMDEDFSWSEVPRRRSDATDAHDHKRQPESVSSFPEPERAVAVVDEPRHREEFDEDVEVVDLRRSEFDLAGHLDVPEEMAMDDGLHPDGDTDAEAYPADLHLDQSAEGDQSATAGRRTVVITGHGAERRLPARQRPSAGLRVHERSGFKPDRIALWAFLLALALLLGATTSSHAAMLAGQLPH